MDKTVKQATFRSVVSSVRLKCTKTEIFRDDGGSDDRSHSASAQSHSPSLYFRFQTFLKLRLLS